MTEQNNAQWQEEVRLGALKACAFFRRLLLSEEPLERDDRLALADMLTYTEEHLQTMWDLCLRDELEKGLHVAMTADAAARIRRERNVAPDGT